MRFGGGQIGCQVKEEHEVPCYIHVVAYQESRVRVMNARARKQSSITHDRSFLVAHVQRQTAFARHLFPVHVHDKMRDIIMMKVVGIRGDSTEKLLVLDHSEQYAIWQASQDSVICRQRLRPARKHESLEFDLRHPVLRASVCAESMARLGRKLLTNNWASRNLNTALRECRMASWPSSI